MDEILTGEVNKRRYQIYNSIKVVDDKYFFGKIIQFLDEYNLDVVAEKRNLLQD